MTLKTFLPSIDASSRQVVHIYAMADQETRCQFREIRLLAEMKSILVQHAFSWEAREQLMSWEGHKDDTTYQLIRLRPTPSRGEELHKARCRQ